jgi:hypothetical protein
VFKGVSDDTWIADQVLLAANSEPIGTRGRRP